MCSMICLRQIIGLLRTPTIYGLFRLAAKKALMFPDCYAVGGPKWTRTTDLTLIRRAL